MFAEISLSPPPKVEVWNWKVGQPLPCPNKLIKVYTVLVYGLFSCY